jgi:hypothetical protein
MLAFFKDNIGLALAIQDYLPVTLFAIGLFFVAKIVAKSNQTAGNLAFIGGGLVTLGGVFKASWKLIQALGGDDIPLLNNSLFVLMSAGFICLSWAFWRRNSHLKTINYWLLPCLLITFFWSIAAYFAFFTESKTWFFILLGATTLANLALLLQLILSSYKHKLWSSFVLLFINFFCIFYLARSSDQSITEQWIKQFANTISQISFLIASFLLYKQTSNTHKQ